MSWPLASLGLCGLLLLSIVVYAFVDAVKVVDFLLSDDTESGDL